jgi:glycosyltransferase involved in cell wall biosynthesis
LGRARTYRWPNQVEEVPAGRLRQTEVDLVVLQRPNELARLCEQWTARRPGRDVPAVYVEHNAPQGRVNDMRHVAADRDDLTLVHVTHFNALFWDAGSTRTRVVEHGIVDPGYRYTGELARIAVAINEPVRRARVTGTDLLPRFAAAGPIDLFGMQVAALAPAGYTVHDDWPQDRMHAELARRRVYAHPMRWTSLGLSLLEAMHLGMPVVALATTEAVAAVPAAAGVVATDVDLLVDSCRRLLREPEEARVVGMAAREAALTRYGLSRFLADWDNLLAEVVAESGPRPSTSTGWGSRIQ